MSQNQTAGTKKISNYIMMIVLIVLALSVVSIILAVSVYLSASPTASQADLTAGFLGVIGLVALAMSMFTLYQSRRQVAEMKIEIPKVMTTVGCNTPGCDAKTVREFQRGDYVYKELDTPCQKCSGRQMITAVYKEVKEKEKTYNV